MKLIYRIALRLSLVLLPLMALWAALFYYTMVGEINDEADDALEDYSTLIISRMLAGRELPSLNSGSNNSYSITPVDAAYADTHPHIDYYDADIFIPEKDETEPARVLVTIFTDRDGLFYELKVATPTFEKDDLLVAIAYWVVILYILLLLTTIGLTVWVFHRSMRPLYELLHWLDRYTPGRRTEPVPDNTSVSEFHRLNAAAQRAVDRSEELFERQKQFIGNASHELQTPLAVVASRIEWLIDNTPISEQQALELLKIQRTVAHMSRLNRTLLIRRRGHGDHRPRRRHRGVRGDLRLAPPARHPNGRAASHGDDERVARLDHSKQPRQECLRTLGRGVRHRYHGRPIVKGAARGQRRRGAARCRPHLRPLLSGYQA